MRTKKNNQTKAKLAEDLLQIVRLKIEELFSSNGQFILRISSTVVTLLHPRTLLLQLIIWPSQNQKFHPQIHRSTSLFSVELLQIVRLKVKNRSTVEESTKNYRNRTRMVEIGQKTQNPR